MDIRKCIIWFLVLLPAFGPRASAQKTDIGAIGRITPRNGIVSVTCVAGDIIDTVVVHAGDRVAKGAPLMKLRAEEDARLNLESARLAVREVRELGPMTVALQRLKRDSAEQDLQYARKRLLRFREIGGDSISVQQMEEREYRAQSAALAFDLARQELDRAEREQQYRQARADHDLKAAEAAMKRLTVQSPIDGTVLDILRNPGDRTDGSPVARIADLREMMVVAEVFEGDVKKLAKGMKATVTSNALNGKLTGRVHSISPMVERSEKTVLVQILLDNPQEASRFVNMETNVVISGK